MRLDDARGDNDGNNNNNNDGDYDDGDSNDGVRSACSPEDKELSRDGRVSKDISLQHCLETPLLVPSQISVAIYWERDCR